MPRGCDHSVQLRLEIPDLVNRGKKPRGGYRTFIVEFDADGVCLRIKEVRVVNDRIQHVAYWKQGTHPLGSGETLSKYIITKAREKLCATSGRSTS